MSETTANYPNSVLLSNLRDTRRFKDDNKKVGVEEQKLLSNPATKFSDFVNADKTIKTMATTNIEELCQPVKSGNGIEDGGNDKQLRNPQFLSLVKMSQALKLSGDTCAPTILMILD